MNAGSIARAADRARQRQIGQRVRAARLRAGLSPARTVAPMRDAGFANWYVNTLVTAEAGTRRLRPLELPALAEILDSTVENLGGLDG